MRAVLTGATGLLGRALLERLLKEGHEPVALGRDPAAMAAKLPASVKCFHFDLANPLPPEGLESGDVIFHCAALLGNAEVDRETYLRCNTESVRVLAEAARDAGAGLFQFISSVSANGPCGLPDRPLTEGHEFRPASVYGESKALAEQALAEVKGLKVQVLRPPVIYGAGANRSSSASKIFRLLKGKAFLKGGSNHFNVIALENLVDACLFLANLGVDTARESAPGLLPPNASTWMVRDEPAPSMAEFQELIIAAYGKRPLLLPLPYPLMRLLGSLGDRLRVRGLHFPLTTEIAQGFATDGYWSDQSRLLAAGWKPPRTTAEAVRDTAASYQKANSA